MSFSLLLCDEANNPNYALTAYRFYLRQRAVIKSYQIKRASDTIFGSTPYVAKLGIAQDAGYPHGSCSKLCCADLWNQKYNG